MGICLTEYANRHHNLKSLWLACSRFGIAARRIWLRQEQAAERRHGLGGRIMDVTEGLFLGRRGQAVQIVQGGRGTERDAEGIFEPACQRGPDDGIKSFLQCPSADAFAGFGMAAHGVGGKTRGDDLAKTEL